MADGIGEQCCGVTASRAFACGSIVARNSEKYRAWCRYSAHYGANESRAISPAASRILLTHPIPGCFETDYQRPARFPCVSRHLSFLPIEDCFRRCYASAGYREALDLQATSRLLVCRACGTFFF